MLATLLMASVLAAGPVKVRVEVKEYITQKPVPGAQVALRADPQKGGAPLELRGTTGADGRVWFDTPHLDFAPGEITARGYVPRSELQPFRGEFKTLERRQPRGGEELFWIVWVVPRSWWQENMKAVTREQAVALAHEWGRECGPAAAPVGVRYDEKQRLWFVDYDCMQVLVRPKSGDTLLRRQTPVTATALYPPEDALADALASPLKFIALDPSPGGGRIPACAFRNDRVFVINRYCTKKEIHSTGIKIIHPVRGVVSFYAEAKAPISRIHRDEYEQWQIETWEPFPGARLDMSYEAVTRHEQRRLRLTDQLCSAGFGVREEVTAGCYKKTPEIERWWAATQERLLEAPPESWYRLVKVARDLAVRQGGPDRRGSDKEPVETTPVMPSGAPSVGSGPARIIVEVLEYYTHKPVQDARVVVREHGGTRELVGTTGSDGKVRFQAPDVHFEPVRAEKPGLVPPEELETVWSAFKSLDHRSNRRGAAEMAWTVPVVPRAWLDANMKARTREQALAVAAKWGSECGPGGPVSAEFVSQSWTFTYPCMVVRVDPWTGKAGARKTTPKEITSTPLYPPEEALADALSSPLQHVGTGVWFGYSIPSCVYRNTKVFVVNRYCTFKEINPTKIMVFHPKRGVVSFRAEGDHDRPVSTIRRDQYAEWSFSSSDPSAGLELGMSATEMVQWDRRRQRFYSTPGCSAGLSTSVSAKQRGRCAQKTAEVERGWAGVYPKLLEAPPESWYQLVKTLRQRAPADGRSDPRLNDRR